VSAPQPRLQIGDTIGWLTVVEYLGRGTVNPATGVQRAAPLHWYRLQCDCGEETIRSQGSLFHPRGESKCETCNEILMKEAGRVQYQQQQRREDPPPVDFATLRWR